MVLVERNIVLGTAVSINSDFLGVKTFLSGHRYRSRLVGFQMDACPHFHTSLHTSHILTLANPSTSLNSTLFLSR